MMAFADIIISLRLLTFKNISHIIIHAMEGIPVRDLICYFVIICYSSYSNYRHRNTLILRCSIHSTSFGSLFFCSCSLDVRGGCGTGTGIFGGVWPWRGRVHGLRGCSSQNRRILGCTSCQQRNTRNTS